MVVVADINTLWRRKPFEALAQFAPVLGFAPYRMGHGTTSINASASVGNFTLQSLALPPGWASTLAPWTAWCLWRRSRSIARRRGQRLDAFFVTSPHYLPLVRRIRQQVPVFYYCSDDYSQYEGWGGNAFLDKEAQLVRAVQHSFFVSRPLADRAAADYGVSADAVSVSPNATDKTFLRPVADAEIQTLLNRIPQLQRPLLGVVGGINDRLDFHLLRQCAELPGTGSLVLVGGVDPACADEDLKALQNHPKVIFAGQRPHSELPAWMQALDVARIPYRPTPLNHACSPMRIYDHLAAGKPIVATDACAQVGEFRDLVSFCQSRSDFTQRLGQILATPPSTAKAMRALVQTAHLWEHRAQALAQAMELPNSRVAV